MPWFKIDDGFHCHPKVFAAGTPAVGLYVRCGSWAAQQVTDGVVPKHVAKMYGTPRMIKALVDAGLWHQAGHECTSCAEVPAGDYLIHQYLQKNPSRAETDDARKAKSERQQRWREGKRAADGANSEGNSHRVGSKTKRNSHRVEGEFASTSDRVRDTAGEFPQVNYGDKPDVDASTPRHGDAAPVPARPVPVTSFGSNGAAAEQASSGGIPDGLAELKRGIAAAGIEGIGWDLKPSQWEYARQAMDRVGVPAMVAYAANSARLKGIPATAGAWVGGWRSLEAAPEPGAEVAYLPAAVGAPVLPFAGPLTRQQRDQAATNDMFDRAMQRAQAREEAL